MIGMNLAALMSSKKAKKAADLIGSIIAKQIELALIANRPVALPNLSSGFLVGYIYEFTRLSFTSLGLKGDLVDRFIKRITKRTSAVGLYSLFEHQLHHLEYAKSLNIRDQIDDFEQGSLYGAFDGSSVNYLLYVALDGSSVNDLEQNIYRSFKNRSLYRYLKNESLPELVIDDLITN